METNDADEWKVWMLIDNLSAKSHLDRLNCECLLLADKRLEVYSFS
ncbi:MAG: hypothetical protein KAR12_15015 [Methylococcales bacterium]|nr:hypothetical protein [Methylococcales bacterium]